MALEEKDAYIEKDLMKLEPDTLRYMVADLTAALQDIVTLRDQFAMAANHEDLSVPDKLADAAGYIGVSVEEYNANTHWPVVVAKARYEFADAMMEARIK